jgi:glucose-6-phosphate 1-dehydrogenase
VNRANDSAAQSDALVLFGVTGDLAHKMIFPALYAMAKRGVLTVPVVGVAAPNPVSAARAKVQLVARSDETNHP